MTSVVIDYSIVIFKREIEPGFIFMRNKNRMEELYPTVLCSSLIEEGTLVNSKTDPFLSFYREKPRTSDFLVFGTCRDTELYCSDYCSKDKKSHYV